MDMDFASKRLGNAALTTGIIGTALGAVNTLGGMGNGLLNGVNGMNYVPYNMPYNDNCHHHHDCFENSPISKYEFNEVQGYIRQIEDKNSEIAYLRAEKYSDKVGTEVYKELAAMIKDERLANESRFAAINQQLGAQAVMNQSTKDSFQLMQERLECCKNEMCGAINRERDERRCADNTIVTYVNATFYPKQVADVTVGTTTVPQSVYNPLPVASYGVGGGCGCGC